MNPILILDGGMGRELLRRGAPFRQPEWSALALTEAPDAVRDAHLDFIRAGTQVITTNSYAVVPFHIGARFDNEAQILAASAGRLACEAVGQSGRNVQVAASLPPLFGSYRPDLFDAEKAPTLAAPLVTGLAPYADIWLAETVSSLAEARAWKAALPDDGKPFWLSFTLDDAAPHTVPQIRSGESATQAAQTALELGAAALLFNCSAPEAMEAAVRTARHTVGSKMRVGVYANALVTEDNNSDDANGELSSLRDDTQPEAYLRWARQWIAAGADTVGGCCGIGPEHIRVLADGLAGQAV
ncbi:homocysteine S-methyltransferase family protein [Neisseria chenwenguii]|uniref:Homocysteine S-methyltransferase n=1 Tax=Neisseria chenwenguii TaxID=1853278 RepID=A0A220S5K2_9NEIS|nr:homocysteine S-methyltransferase family protein [Neisseria chenwenguii]ASK28568.1 homocysteine S-methyltransferase [Neisseria chenwenguii]ROV57433.1 homocysteine S-methyltransferase family protein [Neisseria chenwenguii]